MGDYFSCKRNYRMVKLFIAEIIFTTFNAKLFILGVILCVVWFNIRS